MPRARRSFTTEYKVEAAYRVIDSGRTIAEVARELGVDDEPFRSTTQLHRPRLAGQCWDNADAESLWSTLKHEYYYRHKDVTLAELVAAVDTWMNSTTLCAGIP
jgi:hypothetical protein